MSHAGRIRPIRLPPSEDAGEDITPELQADDVHRLIGALGGGPVDYLGSSGGAVVGLALAQARPDVLRRLVAHEPVGLANSVMPRELALHLQS